MKPRSKKSPAPSERQRFAPESEERDEPFADHRWVKSSTVLEDYLDEEVVDEKGKLLGTLSCYWETDDNGLVFCGINMNDQQGVRVVPGDDAQFSERHSWVRVAYPSAEVATAPIFGCEQELDAEFERTVYEHYAVEDIQRHGALKYLSRH